MNRVTHFIKNYPAISFVLGLQLFRLFLLPFMGIMPQDAYYHFYGENLALSYFDHPGMIGYMLRLFTSVFGKTVFVVKFADFIVTSFTLLSFYKLGSYFLPKQKLKNSLVLLSSTFFISILSFNSTPDVPLILFWTLSLISLHKAIFEKDNKHWVFAGIAMGLAFNSKYTSLLLQFGLLAFVLFSNNYRKLLKSPFLWLSIITSIIVTTPVWLWNYQHDFASFLFQSSNRTEGISKFQFTPRYIFGAIGHQIFLLLPILFISFIVLTYKHIKKALVRFKLPSDKTLFLLAFFIPTFVGFFLLTPVYWVKLNWMMPSYISGVILASYYVSKKLVKTQAIISVVLHLLASLQIFFYIAPIKSDDTWVGWEELSIETKELQKSYPNTFIFSDDNYKTSAVLNFYLDQKVYAQNIIGKPALQFDYVNDDLTTLIGKNALFIDSDKRFKTRAKKGKTPPLLQNYFEKVTELDPIIVKTHNKETRKFWVFHCVNYQQTK